jgi:hypothetical protein
MLKQDDPVQGKDHDYIINVVYDRTDILNRFFTFYRVPVLIFTKLLLIRRTR